MTRQRWSAATAVAALMLGLGGCSYFDDEDAGEEVCHAATRRLLLIEGLTRDVASTSFVVEAGMPTWASVIVDVDYNPSALFPGVADLYLIDADAQPQITRDASGLPTIGDRRLSFDREGQFRRLDVEPGPYRLWSTRGPTIEVVACPAEPES